MTELYVKDSGSWREIKEVHVKDSGVWREIQEAYVKESGAWKLFFQALPSYTGVSSSNIGTITGELVTDFPDVILSAGPLFGSTRSNTAGAYEIVVAPGHRLAGDTDTNWNRSRRYVIEVSSGGFSYSTASKYNLQNERSGLRTATANNNLQFERDVSSFTDGTVLEFNHPARWGNASSSTPSVYFDYTLPRATQDYSIYGGGGGGGIDIRDATSGGSGGLGGGGNGSSVDAPSVSFSLKPRNFPGSAFGTSGSASVSASQTVDVEQFCSWSACRRKMRSMAFTNDGGGAYFSYGVENIMFRKFSLKLRWERGYT